jgi:hypothetical protein
MVLKLNSNDVDAELPEQPNRGLASRNAILKRRLRCAQATVVVLWIALVASLGLSYFLLRRENVGTPGVVRKATPIFVRISDGR